MAILDFNDMWVKWMGDEVSLLKWSDGFSNTLQMILEPHP